MYGYFCIGFIDFMLNDKSLLDYTNLFSANDFEKKKRYNNTKTFSISKKMKQLYSIICGKYRDFEKL